MKILLKLQLWIANFVGFLIANPIFAYLLIGFIVIVLIVGQFQSCSSRRAERKDKENQIEIQKDKGRIEIIEEQRNAQIQNNNVARQQSEAANANDTSVTRTDTNQRDGNFSAVKRKFCETHPNDSKCK